VDSQELLKSLFSLNLNKNNKFYTRNLESTDQQEKWEAQKQIIEENPQEHSYKSGLKHERVEDEKNDDDLSINNNEIVYKGNKFQITSSFLFLIRNICDYSEIGFRFKFVGLDAISKIFELIKVKKVLKTQVNNFLVL